VLRDPRRTLRRLLLIVGIATIVWLPLSFVVGWLASIPLPAVDCQVSSANGAVVLFVMEKNPFREKEPLFAWGLSAFVSTPDGAASFPTMASTSHSHKGTWREWEVTVPLWLVAVVCLAWPLMPNIPTRRGIRRGFPVEPGPDRSAEPSVRGSPPARDDVLADLVAWREDDK
jgi:hypothetical protein